MRHAVSLPLAVALLFLLPGLAYPAPKPAKTPPQANIELHVVPQAEFPAYVPTVVPGNIGYFAAYWNGRGEITRAIALVASDADQTERVHCIREEITQSLGPMRDSYKYPDSIFYQPWSVVHRFTNMDKALIRELYLPQIRPNMDEAQVRQALKGTCPPDVIDYLVEISCGAEYNESDELIHKWLHDPVIHVSGELTDVDVQTINQVVRDLNGLTGQIRVHVSGWSIQARGPDAPPRTAVAAVTAKPKPGPKAPPQQPAGGSKRKAG